MAPQRREGERLVVLDALRTLAAIGVVLYHAPHIFPTAFSRAYLFVDLFFLLSGFVLTLTAEPRMQVSMSTSGFLYRRLVRLWPTMAIGALAGAAVFSTQVGFHQVFLLLLLALLVVPFPPGAALFPLNGPQWSLLWELAANVGHAALLHRLGNRPLLTLAGVSGLLLVATIMYGGCNGFGPNGDGWLLAAPRVAWSYIAGIWMARRWQERKPDPLIDWKVALLMPLAALLVLPWLPLSVAGGDALMVTIVLPLLFWVCTTARPPVGATRALAAVGSISFPIYALHAPSLNAFHFLAGVSRWTDAAGVTTCLALSIAMAWIGPRLRSANNLRANRSDPAPMIPVRTA